MKTATLPAIRVTPQIRLTAESLLQEGETLTMFLQDSLERNIAHRAAEREFTARGLQSAASARASGNYVSAQDSLAELRSLRAKHTAQ
jgi:hypothetical protein